VAKQELGPEYIIPSVFNKKVAPAVASEVARAAGSGMVCRLVCAQGWAIECGEWPPPSWLSAVLPGRRDAAA